MVLPEFSLLMSTFTCFRGLLRFRMEFQRIITEYKFGLARFYILLHKLRVCFLPEFTTEWALEVRKFDNRYFCVGAASHWVVVYTRCVEDITCSHGGWQNHIVISLLFKCL